MSIEEQAKALVRDLAPGPYQNIAGWACAIPTDARKTIVQVANGFLAGHEAASRPRQVTTVGELDALPVGSVVLDRHGEVWRKTAKNDWTAAGLGRTSSSGLAGHGKTARVLYVPEEES